MFLLRTANVFVACIKITCFDAIETRYRHVSADQAAHPPTFPGSYDVLMNPSSQMPVQLLSPTSRPLSQARPEMASPTPSHHSLSQHSVALSAGTNPAAYSQSNPRPAGSEPSISPQSINNSQSDVNFDFSK